MSRYFDNSFAQVLEESASSNPTPGGGSVAAMAGSFGAAMISMVANLSTGEKYAEYESQVNEILAEIQEVLNKLEKQVDEDMEVFEAFMSALRMPKNNEEEKASRKEAMQEAYKKATLVPLDIADTCLEALELGVRLAPFGNKSAISDVGVGAVLADASLQSVLLAVDINLPGIKDDKFVEESETRKESQLQRSAELKDETLRIVKSRL